MVAYCPKGEQVHVVQTFPRETLHGSTKFTADYIGAVGIWRNPSGEWTTVYHVQQDEISRTQMKWITEEMVCGQALEMLWLKHGRLHLEGGTISLRVHRDVNSWPQSLPQNTIQLTKITDEARFPSLVECQRQFQQPRKWLGHVNEADDWSSFPPSPIFAGPVHRDAVSLDSDKTDLTSHQRTWKRPSCRSGLKASSRRQKFFNRTKTGCFTCRSRRKKCDGTQPICQNCERLEINCSWPRYNIGKSQNPLTAHSTLRSTQIQMHPRPGTEAHWNRILNMTPMPELSMVRSPK